MGEILTSAQIRAKERTAMDSGFVSGRTLMERAGAGVVKAAIGAMGGREIRNKHAVVLCGPGNNGGDGFVIARLLSGLGWQVEVFFYGKAETLSDDARHMHDLWAGIGAISTLTPEAAAKGSRPTFMFDAMFGIGISRPIPPECAMAFRAVTERPALDPEDRVFVVAVDCPSGFDVDSGRILLPPTPDRAEEVAANGPLAVGNSRSMLLTRTDLCVTFHAPKVGHCLVEVGRVQPAVVDIGLPKDDHPDPAAKPVPPAGAAVSAWLQGVAAVGTGGHKYQRGHVLVLGGGCGKGGAGRLAARAALRVGAGLVTLAVPPVAMAENAAQLNAIMLSALDGPAALEDMLADTRLSSICLGPGLGVGAGTRELVLAALRMTAQDGRRVVLDADALSSFADDPQVLFNAVHKGVVITPHEGEFARLFPDLSERRRQADPSRPGLSKVAATVQAASRLGATILLKGEATVLADPRGKSAIHSALYDRSAPWLGTAGAGDVLAGLIAGLSAHQAARVSAPIDLAAAAAWLHVECARSFGPGLIAEDLPEELPKVFRKLGV